MANPDFAADLTRQLDGKITSDATPACRQLETLANYIMYGKSLDNTNAIERKEISRPASRYSTFARKPDASLDELTESPTFAEQDTKPIARNTYLNPKRKIIRPVYALDLLTNDIACINESVNDARIDGMAALWHSIDYLEGLAGKQVIAPEPYTKNTYLVNGRRVHKINHPVREIDGKLTIVSPTIATPAKLTPLMAYRLKHWIIDQKRHQYYLKESNSPTAFASHFSVTPASPVEWEEDSGYWLTHSEALRLNKQVDSAKWRWRGTTRFEYEEAQVGERLIIDPLDGLDDVPGAPVGSCWVREYWHLVCEHTLDFTNPLHVYALLENFRDLKVAYYDKPQSQVWCIIDSFSEIVNRTDLHESRDIILYYKVHKWTNERIARELEEFGYSYATNYISTIYKQEICNKVARQAAVMHEEWLARGVPTAWRKCTRCAKKKLMNSDNFTSKPKNYLGLSYQCKVCDRERREERKNG